MIGSRRSGRVPRAAARWLVALASSLLALTGCSGVPTSSLPQVVRTVEGPGVATTPPPVRPEDSDDAQTTVAKFLNAQVTNDELHQAAKAFLTPQAATKWQDATVTVVREFLVGYPNARNVVSVTGQVIGTLDSNGIYTPTLIGPGVLSKTFQFTLRRVGTQWRISDLPGGLIVAQKDFLTSFQRRNLYFFNQAETRLVPDLRYSPLDGQSLVSWVLEQLIAGPQPEQANALRNEFPDGVDPQRAKVTLSQPINVQLPGLSQSDDATVDRIAAEIGYAFEQFAPSAEISLFDGTAALKVAGGSTVFTAAAFARFSPLPSTPPSLYYLRDGALATGSGTPVPGKGANQYGLASVAVTGDPGHEQIAGLTSLGDVLYIGTAAAGLQPVRLHRPATSRPEWVIASPNEVWFGTATGLARAVGPSRSVQSVALGSLGTDLSKLSVRAVRVSPEGSRIALVLDDIGGSGSVWVGNVARSGDSVQVEGLRQITPSDWQVRDVAWSTGGIALRAIGSERGAQIEIWQVNCDGSAPSDPSSDQLPASPDWITSDPDGATWVSVSDHIFTEQSLGGWMNPFITVQQRLSAPIYSVN